MIPKILNIIRYFAFPLPRRPFKVLPIIAFAAIHSVVFGAIGILALRGYLPGAIPLGGIFIGVSGVTPIFTFIVLLYRHGVTIKKKEKAEDVLPVRNLFTSSQKEEWLNEAKNW